MDTVNLTNALKSLFGTSQTTATNLPICSADGTPGGNISVANLASVLGGLPYRGSINDCNSVIGESGLYGVQANSSNSPFEYCQLISFKNNNNGYVFQLAYNLSSGARFATRVGTGGWTYYDEFPSFYKDYANLTSLATATHNIIGKIETNILDSKSGSYWFATPVPLNVPTGVSSGYAIVTEGSYAIVIDYPFTALYINIKFNSIWQGWKKTSLTAI